MTSEPQGSSTDPFDKLSRCQGGEQIPKGETTIDTCLLLGLGDTDQPKDRAKEGKQRGLQLTGLDLRQVIRY